MTIRLRIGPRQQRSIALVHAAIVLSAFAAVAVPLRPSLSKLSTRDTVCKVWVIFTDKKNVDPAPRLAPRAAERRRRAGVDGATLADIAISRQYCDGLTRLGCRIGRSFKWANAVSVTAPSALLIDIAALPYVKDIVGVRTFRGVVGPTRGSSLMKKQSYDTSSFYGSSYGQLALLHVPEVHRYCSTSLSAAPGSGVLIGLFDSGFRTKHACFSEFNAGAHLLADSDFIDNDGTVADPDSVASNSASVYYRNDEHGSMTLSLIAGYDPTKFTGVAWGAKFILARTEDTKLTSSGEIEKHYEEDNWAAAMVWAESLGVDIVSSSLGYRDGFTPPDTDYTFRDMNGSTTIISKAASMAVTFGVVVVNAMGNEGPSAGSMDAPADVDGVVSVGAINADKTIAYFSSRGPTSDGRIKPDCVAQGSAVSVPDIYGGDGTTYAYGDGTSFSTPLVAGVCALIKQTHPLDAPAITRGRLFSSCVFVPTQQALDNTFGRGLPDARMACLPFNIIVFLKDTLTHAVQGAVFYRSGDSGPFIQSPTDTAGIARLTGLSSSTIELYAEAGGYLGSSHLLIHPADTGNLALTITLLSRPVSQLVIFPNVFDVGKKHQQLRLEFTASADNPRAYSQIFSASIRSVDGALVWSSSRYLTENTPLVLTWPALGKIVAPGVYFFIVNYAGKTYRQKFLITG